MDEDTQNLETIEPEDHVVLTDEDQITEAELANINDEDHGEDPDADTETEHEFYDDVQGEYENDIDLSIGNDTAPGDTKALVVVTDDQSEFDHFESEVPEANNEISSEEDVDLSSIQKEDEKLAHELESRVIAFEERLNEMQMWVESGFEMNGTLISSLGNELNQRAGDNEVKQLKSDFDLFSKKLRRVVQAEDSVNAETLDATKVPSDVLEITYAKTLNDLYAAMLGIYGDREACEMVEDTRDSVRQFSAGIDFFRFEDESFVVRGLSDAIASKIVSVKQIHGTYVELFKMLSQYVPNYNSQDFRAFVETGSREYTIEKVVSHEKHIEKLISDIKGFRDEVGSITENVSFIAELQNNHVDEIEGKSQELTDIKEQMKAIAKAVNLHTKAINKLNKNLVELRDLPVAKAEVPEQAVESADLTKIEEMVVSRASKEEIVTISGEMESFKANVESMFASVQQQLEENMLSSRKLKGIEDELSNVVKELDQIHVAEETQQIAPADMSTEDESTDIKIEPDTMIVVEEKQTVKLPDMPIEDVIICHLSVLGSATLKQLEKQIKNEGLPMDFEKLSLVMSYLEQEKLVSSAKKGRYTFYSVADPVNI